MDRLDRIDRIDRIAEWLRPDEIQPAFNLVELLKHGSQLSAAEATEWRRRIEAWARFHALAAETEPSGFVPARIKATTKCTRTCGTRSPIVRAST